MGQLPVVYRTINYTNSWLHVPTANLQVNDTNDDINKAFISSGSLRGPITNLTKSHKSFDLSIQQLIHLLTYLLQATAKPAKHTVDVHMYKCAQKRS